MIFCRLEATTTKLEVLCGNLSTLKPGDVKERHSNDDEHMRRLMGKFEH